MKIDIGNVIVLSFRNFLPDRSMKNPVMFVTELAFFISVAFAIFPGSGAAGGLEPFYIAVASLLFMTVFLSNLSDAISEGKSKVITSSLSRFKKESVAHLVTEDGEKDVGSQSLRKGDILMVRTGEVIPIDGEIIEGSGYVNESNITGESRPVLKVLEDSVTGSTTLVTDTLKIRVTANAGETFVDNMIKLIGSARRERTSNEIALSVFLSAMTLVFLIVTSLIFSVLIFLHKSPDIIILIVLLIALIPTTIGALLPTIGVAAINKISEYNVIAKSGRAIESAGDIDTIILDKTGTVTMGEREAVKFYPNKGVEYDDFVRASALASFQDQTKEGMSVVKLASIEGLQLSEDDVKGYDFLPFSAETKYSGITKDGERILKGALRALTTKTGMSDQFIEALCKEISMKGGTALPVVRDDEFIGVIELNDMLKPGIRERLASLREMNIKTIMCTGDDEVTAAYIARESGIDEYVANTTPEGKYDVVMREKNNQRMVAMVGDGTNDAPALAKADVGLAMNNGTQTAKDSANMVDLDSDPTKLMDVIILGKQILITRGALTTFSFANDIAKYFVIIPAIFYFYPGLSFLNILALNSPIAAITSALLYNTFVILALIPMAVRGVRFRPSNPDSLLRRNILIYGIGGIVIPFIAIKIIYTILVAGGVAW